jgi:hypothetical protein
MIRLPGRTEEYRRGAQGRPAHEIKSSVSPARHRAGRRQEQGPRTTFHDTVLNRPALANGVEVVVASELDWIVCIEFKCGGAPSSKRCVRLGVPDGSGGQTAFLPVPGREMNGERGQRSDAACWRCRTGVETRLGR